MKHFVTMTVMVALLALGAYAADNSLTETSPNGNVVARLDVRSGKAYYDVTFKGKPVIKPSLLGFDLVGKRTGEFNNFEETHVKPQQVSLCSGFHVSKSDHATFDETWRPVWGEETAIRNHYNEMAVMLEQRESGRQMVVRFRVYDDGVGFRYEFPQQKNLNYFVIAEERTEFAMTGDHTAWWIGGDYDTQEYEYTRSRLSEIRGLFDGAICPNSS